MDRGKYIPLSCKHQLFCELAGAHSARVPILVQASSGEHLLLPLGAGRTAPGRGRALRQCETKELKLGNITELTLLKENLAENCIPETVIEMDASRYDEFLIERRKLMAAMMRRYYMSL